MTARSTVALAAGVATFIAVGAATLAARHAHPAEVSPVVPAGAWNAVWVAAVVGGLVLYATGVFATARAQAHRQLGPVLALAVAIQVVPLAGPLLLSKDAYLYWMQARIVAVHRQSPYRATPAEFPRDPALPWVSEAWHDDVAAYGPTWETLALVPATAAGNSHRSAATAFRLLAVVGVLTTLLLVALSTRRPAAVAVVGWNPLIALHFGGGGHNDASLVALLAVAIIAATRWTGGAAWAFASAVKPVPLALLPLDLAARGIRRTRAFWLGLLISAVGIIAIAGAFWGFGWVRSSLAGESGVSPLGGVHWLTEAGLPHRWAVVCGGLVFLAVYAALLTRARRTGRAGMSLAATALCLTSSLLRPWYAIWPLTLSALEEDPWGAAAAVALSAYLLLGDAVGF